MVHGGLLTLRTGVNEDTGDVVVEIRDSGTGMDEDTRETMAEFSERMLLATQNARGLIALAQQNTKNDPVLVEHQARGGDK